MHSVKTKAEMLNTKYSEFFSDLQMSHTDSLTILNSKYVQRVVKTTVIPIYIINNVFENRLSLVTKNLEEYTTSNESGWKTCLSN